MSNSILYLHEGFKNPGDCFSYCGVRHYVNRFPVACEQSIALKTSRDIPGLISMSGPDLVVLAGAPWFWDGCVNSEKYSATFGFLQMCRNTRKIAVGVGSCFLSSHSLTDIERMVMRDRDMLKSFWEQFDHIIVRDLLAWKILDMIGIHATYAICPSIGVGEWFGRLASPEGELVLAEDLRDNFIFSYIPDSDRALYQETCLQKIEQGAKLINWIVSDRFQTPSRSVKTIASSILEANCQEFYTARVHAALVCSGMGMAGVLHALDSRSLSVVDRGISLAGLQGEAFCRMYETLKVNSVGVADIAQSISRIVGDCL